MTHWLRGPSATAGGAGRAVGSAIAETASTARRSRLRWLACAAGLLGFLAGAGGEAVAAPIESSLVHTIATSGWSPASPDPSGVAYDPVSNRLLVVDGEVDEMSIFKDANYYEATLGDSSADRRHDLVLGRAGRGRAGCGQPGLHLDDDQRRVFELALGSNGLFDSGDSRSSFSVTTFGCRDPEGVSYDRAGNRLFIADGEGKEIWEVAAVDGFFGNSNDLVRHFDTGTLGVSDPRRSSSTRDRNAVPDRCRGRQDRPDDHDGHATVRDRYLVRAARQAGGPGLCAEQPRRQQDELLHRRSQGGQQRQLAGERRARSTR